MILPRELYLMPIYVFSRTTPRFWHLIQNRFVTYAMFRIWKKISYTLQMNLSVLLDRPPNHPLVKEYARRTWFNYGLYMVDYVQLNLMGRSTRDYLIPEQKGVNYVRQALDDGRGGILITPHLGNWELGGVTFAMRGCPIHTLTLKNPQKKVQDFRDNMRATLGMNSIHIDFDFYETVLKLARLLRENQFIAMLGDRWEGGKSAEVSFFGRKVRFPAGAPALALATGAPIIPVFTVAKPKGRYLAWAEPPIHVKRKSGQSTSAVIEEKTQELAKVFEMAISDYPDQWYHFFDYWSRYGF